MENKKHFSKMGLFLLLGSIIVYVVQLLASVITNKIPVIAESSDLSFLAAMLPMYIIAFPLIFLLFKRIPVQLTGEKKKMRPLHIFVTFLMCYAGTYICNIVANVIAFIIGAILQNQVDNVMLSVTSSISLPVNVFVVVICAPIMEELLFRKTLIDRTAQYGEGMAIVFSGLVFGLFHGNLVQFAYAFFLGVFFGFIYIKTRNIVYPIILHMITNFLGSFVGTIILDASNYLEFANKMMEISTTGSSEAELMAVMTEYAGGLLIFFGYFLCLIGLVIAGIVLFCINFRKFHLNAGEITIEKGKRFSTMVLNVGMLLYAAYWIVMIVLQLLGI